MVREILLENAGQAGAARKTYLGECGPTGGCGDWMKTDPWYNKGKPKKSAPKKKTAPKKKAPAKKKTTWTTASGTKAKRLPNGKIKYTQPSGGCGPSGSC